MKWKKFVASDIKKALDKAIKELGVNPIIYKINEKQKKHFFNLFSSNKVEIFAASSNNPAGKQSMTKDQSDKLLKKSNINEIHDNSHNEIRKSNFKKSEKAIPTYEIPRSINPEVQKLLDGPRYMSKIHDYLYEQGMKEKFIKEILTELVQEWYIKNKRLNQKTMIHIMKNNLIKSIKHSEINLEQTENKLLNDRFHMFVGPTGAGKTTTAIKIASKYIIENNKKVVFLTSDTYRVGAIDQLIKYANILKSPYSVINDNNSFKKACEKYKNVNYVFIDTAGHNMNDETYVDELKKMVGKTKIYLNIVLPSAFKAEDLDIIEKKFNTWENVQFIITKLDETSSYGSIVNFLISHPNVKVSYITNGQKVPEDIENFKSEVLISKMIAGLESN